MRYLNPQRYKNGDQYINFVELIVKLVIFNQKRRLYYV